MEPRRALIRRRNGNLPEKFEPEKFRLNDTALDFGIDEAKRIKDWTALETAVDIKIEEQLKFVAWWESNVRIRGAGSHEGKSFRSETFTEAKAKQLTGVGKVQKHRMSIRLRDPKDYRQRLLGASYLAANLADPDNFRAEGTGNNEWHTPAKYIEIARKVLGEIELDPATSKIAQKTIQAKKFFTRDDNGLDKPWNGRIWLNPPYSPKEIAAFASKICEECQSGRVTAAIMLTHNYTDSSWFQRAAAIATSICFTNHRIRFEDPDGVPCSPTQGQAFFYFGKDPAKFVSEFSNIGFVMRKAT